MDDQERLKLKQLRDYLFKEAQQHNIANTRLALTKAISYLDTLFETQSLEVATVSRKQLYLLWDKYGTKDRKACPICLGEMILRKNKKGNTFFMGCAAFPACKGVRDSHGHPSFNAELAAHLVKLGNQETEITKIKELGRFADL